MDFVIASNNKGKCLELKKMLGEIGVNAYSASELGFVLDDVEETGTTFAENAYLKAYSAFKSTGYPAISDDSGLSVDYLNGAPGIYSARYAGENATDEQRIEKLLNALKGVPKHKRTAHFTCSICCVFDEDNSVCVEGYFNGIINDKPLGKNGFGYDPVFLVNGKTCGEMNQDEKDLISHRHNAIEKLKLKFIELGLNK